MNRQARIESKVTELIHEFQARLHALGFDTSHEPRKDGEEGLLLYRELKRGEHSCATCEETGTISEWFGKEHSPGRDGLYQVRREGGTSFAKFNDGSWEGGNPDLWRGIDWRISRQEQDRLFSILREEKQGSKPDAALALIRHHLAERSNDEILNTLTDEFGIKEKIYYKVIQHKDPAGARQVLHLVYDDLLDEKVPDHIRQQIEQETSNFDLIFESEIDLP